MPKFTDLKFKSILLRAPNWLGDCVMAIPAIKALRHTYPQSKLIVQAIKPLAHLFKYCPEVDQILEFPPGRGWQNLFAKRLDSKKTAKLNLELGILLPNSFSSAFWLWQANVKQRIGTRTNCRGLLLTDHIELNKKILSCHQAEWYLALAAKAGTENNLQKPELSLPPDFKNNHFVSDLLNDLNLESNKYIVLAPGSAYGPAKDWLEENFIELAKQLAARNKIKIIITGTVADSKKASAIATGAGRHTTSVAGTTDLKSFLALLANAAAFVGNDSGATHCAAAFGIPTIAIFGSSRPERTRPLGNRVCYLSGEAECAPCLKRQCPLKENQMICMQAVSANMVLQALTDFGIFNRQGDS